MKAESTVNSGEGYFTIVEGDKVVIKEGLYYKQVDLYKRGNRAFAEVSKGKFVKLSGAGATSVPAIRWDEIITDKKLQEDGFGILIK